MNNKTTKLYCLHLLALLGLIQTTGFAQPRSKEINTQSQSWISLNNTIRLYKRWGVVADLHVRRTNFTAEPGFYFVRAGIHYWLKDNITMTAGYGQMWMAPAQVNWHHYAQEHRIYQQIQMTSKVGKVTLLNRLRSEQRWQEKIVDDKFTHRFKFTNRTRYLLSLTIPVSKHAYFPSFVVSDELSVQFGKEIVYNTFDQNRLFLGLRQPISKILSFDFGYMLLFQQKSSGYQYDKNHTLRLFFYYTPDLRKKP